MRRLLIAAAAVAVAVSVAVSIPSTRADDQDDYTPAGASRSDAAGSPGRLAPKIARARLALAPFATSLRRAKAAGYRMQITPMMPGMGYHFLNPDVEGFDVRRPPILVYVRRAAAAWPACW